MPRPSLKSMAQRSTRGWGAVFAGGILLTLLALADGPGFGSAAGTATTAGTTSSATGSTGCRMQVTATELTVRSSPSVGTDSVGTLRQGTVVDGLPEVTDGFRHLTGNRWAANDSLVPVAGTSC